MCMFYITVPKCGQMNLSLYNAYWILSNQDHEWIILISKYRPPSSLCNSEVWSIRKAIYME